MNVKALLAMPNWWCFAGNHKPIARVGSAFVQLDFEREARDVRMGFFVMVLTTMMVGYYITRDGDWKLLLMLPAIWGVVVLVMLFSLVNAMQMVAWIRVNDALPVPLVQYDNVKLPPWLLYEVDRCDIAATNLMREMLFFGDQIPVRRWHGFGTVANDIVRRFNEDDVRDWIRRRALHIEDVRRLESQIRDLR
ncbi:MAG: hypothetical protein EON60_10745 [Alphaproteobacteria bacterium]|nr:MAG: hypothetical protein EON60_10745 [Alphaproteobacteria bacterium]